MTVLSYRAHPAVTKAAFVAEMEKHAAADQIQAGYYWADGTGCAIGCGVQSIIALEGVEMKHRNHAAHAKALGIPLWLSLVQDALFENLPFSRQKLFPVQFARALPDGADLSGLHTAWILWVLRKIALPTAKDDTVVCSVINRVADGIASSWTTDDQTSAEKDAWASAWTAVSSAARSAASAAAWASTEDGAWTAVSWAARSAASAARSAASAAAWASTEDGAWTAVGAAANADARSFVEASAYVKMADKLLELMAACPVLAS